MIKTSRIREEMFYDVFTFSGVLKQRIVKNLLLTLTGLDHYSVWQSYLVAFTIFWNLTI